MGGSGLDRTDDFQKFCRSGLDRMQLLRIRIGLGLNNFTVRSALPATVIDPTVIYPCLYLRNDHTDSCYCRNWKVTPHPGPFFPKLLIPGPDPVLKKMQNPAGVDSSIPVWSHLYHLFFSPDPVRSSPDPWSSMLYAVLAETREDQVQVGAKDPSVWGETQPTASFGSSYSSPSLLDWMLPKST